MYSEVSDKDNVWEKKVKLSELVKSVTKMVTGCLKMTKFAVFVETKGGGYLETKGGG